MQVAVSNAQDYDPILKEAIEVPSFLRMTILYEISTDRSWLTTMAEMEPAARGEWLDFCNVYWNTRRRSIPQPVNAGQPGKSL